MTERRRGEPEEMPPRIAVQRYLRRRRPDSTDSSIEGWYYRLKLWAEWCEEVGIETVGELRRYDLDDYYEHRSAQIAPATLEGEMWTLKMFVEYLEQVGAVEQGLSESVRIPDLDPEDKADETSLAPARALEMLRYYRGSDARRATRDHALVELAWHTGARQGGLRALDVRDFNPEKNYVEFHHRPETDTPLKNKRRGERPVGIPSEVSDVVSEYLDVRQYEKRDENGRLPLLSSRYGRPTENTVRVWCYMATLPCRHTTCPHGKDRETCKWTKRGHASKCPSSRSPHKLRTGSITWQLNRGIPPEVVAERVNASVKTIRDHYDWASDEQRWMRLRDRMDRRQEYLTRLNIDDDNPTNA